MSVDTHGRLKGKVEPEIILNFIRQTYDPNATMDIEPKDYGLVAELDWVKETYDETGKWIINSGFINFKDGEENRSLFYFYDNVNSYENLEYYSQYGLEDMVKQETTTLHLGYWGNSVEIMRNIVSQFEGWLDENDCDDEPYYPIMKSPDGNIKPVIVVTMEDIYEKFGGVVIIKR